MLKPLVQILIILGVAAVFSTGVSAQDVVREAPEGGVNWTQGFVYAHGYGTARPEQTDAQRRLLSRRAAIVDAQRNLLEITKGVRITSVLRTDQLMRESRETAARVEGIIKGARVIRDHYQNEVHTVTMVMPIAGEFLKVTWPESQATTWEIRRENRWEFQQENRREIWQEFGQEIPSIGSRIIDLLIPRALATASDPAFTISTKEEADAYRKLLKWMETGAGKNVDGALIEAIRKYESDNRYSGLLIDASNVRNFELATIPQIRDEAGNILYPSPDVSYDDIVNKRGVTYDFDLQDAIRNQRVATTPFTIKAIHTYKNLSSDLVIGTEDAKRILQSASTVEAMNKAGVLIVVAI